jgi:hypothetical protein
MRIAAAALLLYIIPGAQACSVPVFRYALERWPAARFTLTVHHAGPLTEGQRRRVEDVSAFEVRFTDEAVGKPSPWAVLRHPKDETVLWEGPLDGIDVPALCDSPARRELVLLLAGGTSAVWVLLEGGDAKADAAAEAVVRGELARLEKALELPPKHETEPHLLSPLRLALKFAVLRVRRDDPAEAFLVRQLLEVDDDLKGVKGPMVFPVFGRGLALAPMYGEGITAKETAADARFLCGPCSCEAKKDNPGWDLLLSADWPALLKLSDDPRPAVGPRPAPRIAPGVKEEAPPPHAAHAGIAPYLAIGAALLVLGALVVGWRHRRE